jgi:hypothetical protein
VVGIYITEWADWHTKFRTYINLGVSLATKMAKKSDYVRVSIRIPKSVYDAIKASCDETIIRFQGKQVVYPPTDFNKKINEIIKKGMADVEDDDAQI